MKNFFGFTTSFLQNLSLLYLSTNKKISSQTHPSYITMFELIFAHPVFQYFWLFLLQSLDILALRWKVDSIYLLRVILEDEKVFRP